jgi:hypothetical protein
MINFTHLQQRRVDVMHVSIKYLKMCLKADEFQKMRLVGDLKVFEKGDWYTTVHNIEGDKGEELEVTSVQMEKPRDTHLWIPTMDQLMNSFSDTSAIFHFVAITNHWREASTIPYLSKIDDRSGEQLLFAWFMFQQCRKIWNGEEWVALTE